MKPYNGWCGSVRRARGTEFYKQVKSGQIVKPLCCEICGSTRGITYHAEEYGPTWEDYLYATRTLCAYHHGMFHMRHKVPNRWVRMLHRVGSGPVVQSITSLSQFFKVMGAMGDIEYAGVPPTTGIDWLDAVPWKPATGVCKTIKGPMTPKCAIKQLQMID